MARSISHSEASTLLDCGLRWDLSYGGVLLGHTLAPKVTHPRLRDGRAWGIAVATLHDHGSNTEHALDEASMALTMAVSEDADQMIDAGVYDAQEAAETHHRLAGILRHYAETTDPMPISGLEHEIEVAIPSRTGKRKSTKFRYRCFFDGLYEDEHGVWIVEFKLRETLTDLAKIERDRQIRWYAWAYREETGREPVGVIVDERLKRAPEAPKTLQSGKPSLDQRQFTTKALFREAIAPFWADLSNEEREKAADAAEAFAQRRWQARHRLMFRPEEIDEAGQQIVSAAQQITFMESGALYPTRNPNPARCGGCQFNDICTDPGDTELSDHLYRRTVPKGARGQEIPA